MSSFFHYKTNGTGCDHGRFREALYEEALHVFAENLKNYGSVLLIFKFLIMKAPHV